MKTIETKWCESCLCAGENTLATTHSKNPDWARYDFCEDTIPKIGNLLIDEADRVWRGLEGVVL